MNQEALDCLEKVQLSQPTRQILRTWVSEIEMDEVTFQAYLDRLLPNLGEQSRKPVDYYQFADMIQHIGAYWLVLNETPPVGFKNSNALGF